MRVHATSWHLVSGSDQADAVQIDDESTLPHQQTTGVCNWHLDAAYAQKLVLHPCKSWSLMS